MPLPTTQPVDWPDWGVAPTFSSSTINVFAVTTGAEIIAEISAGYFSHVLVVLEADGDGSSWTVDLGWYTGTASEGGSLVGSVQTTRIFPGTIVIPMTAWAPILRITDVLASTYPHNFIATVTLFTARGFQTGYPGGTFAMFENKTIPGSGGDNFIPLGCAPGTHAVQIVTDALTWRLYYTVHQDYGTSWSTLLANQATPQPYNLQFIGPASQWSLDFFNDDVTDVNCELIVTRQP